MITKIVTSKFCTQFITVLATIIIACSIHGEAKAAPYAAVVMDARNGEILHSRSADRILHPASLTKMMTLYVVFEAVENGEISLDTKVNISKRAAAEPPSKLYLRVGSKVRLRYLIRGAAVRSANDASTALAEAIEGSLEAFTKRMNNTAKQMGMNNTHFKNANGLTQKGHYSTARDMTILGRHMVFDYPDYYNLFSRKYTNVGGQTVYNTNRRFLTNYSGADGIKTGYTQAAGFNLVASAKRGNVRIITTVFGGKSTTTRNAQVAKLMDLGFARAKANISLVKPKVPPYGKYTLNGKVLAELSSPTLRPGVLVEMGDMQEKVESVEVDFAGLDDSNQSEIIELGGASDPLMSDGQEWDSFSPLTRPRGLTLLHGTNIVSKNSGVVLGTYYSKSLANSNARRLEFMVPSELFSAKKILIDNGRGIVLKYIGMDEKSAEKVCRILTRRKSECQVIYIR